MDGFLSIYGETERDAAMREITHKNRERGGEKQNQIRCRLTASIGVPQIAGRCDPMFLL